MATTPSPRLTRQHTKVPVTALALHGEYLLSAIDSTLSIYSLASSTASFTESSNSPSSTAPAHPISPQRQPPHLIHKLSPQIFRTTNAGQPIHGITVHPETNAVLLWGASAVCYLPHALEGSLAGEASGRAMDWIYAGRLSGSQDAGKGVLVTAHNDLLPFEVVNQEGGANRLVFGASISPSRPILYSATLTYLSESTLLEAAGTVFGEIIVWKCHLDAKPPQAQTETLFILTGHEGSIFGVDISASLEDGRRLLASCSDDRTIRLWDISEGQGTVGSGHDHQAARETGFITGPSTSQQPIAVAMGHASRIWGVKIVAESAENMVVYSFGEDSTTQRWRVKPGSSALTHEQTFALHDGKHLWSHALLPSSSENEDILIATGGADSKITVIREPSLLVPRHGLITINLSDITAHALTPSKPSKRSKEIITRYDFLSADEVLAMTSSGRLIRGNINSPASTWSLHEVQAEFAEDLGQCYASKAVGPGAVVMGTTSGNVYFYDAVKGLELVTNLEGRIMDLILVAGDGASGQNVDILVQMQGNMSPVYMTVDTSTGALVRKTSLTDVDDRFVTVSALKARGYIFLGSRHGFITVLQDEPGVETSRVVQTLQPRCPDAITSIIEIPSSPDAQAPPLYILTTSRDGNYRIYQFTPSMQTSTDKNDTLDLVHESSTSLGPLLEGAFFTTPTSPSSPPHLIIHGFKGKSFTVFNETLRQELLSVPCGGAHRMHTLYHDPSNPSRLRFAFTKTSQLFIHAQEDVPHQVVETGMHGREVRVLASWGNILATGGEDTTIRFWSYDDVNETQPELRQLASIKHHVTGLQQLRWMSPTHLLSSAGFEEFYIWRVRKLEGAAFAGLAVVCEATFPHKSPDGDLRIMDFDAYWAGDQPSQQTNTGCVIREDAEKGLIITMVLSNSEIKTYSYTQEVGFVLKASGFYTGACLTQIRHLGSDSANLSILTGSTDGHLCIWTTEESSEGAATYRVSQAKQIHQNTIKALDMLSDSNGYTIFTGGDDDALHLSHIATSSPTSSSDCLTVSHQSSIARAHTASINGVQIIAREDTLYGVSVSNDQRVKTWRLGPKETPEGRQLKLLRDSYSGVADVGDIETMEGRVVVGGVGVEIWGFVDA